MVPIWDNLGRRSNNGDLAGAQQEFNAIQTLGQSGPFANGDAFKISQRQQDFAAIGQALQAGDLAGAQQAFAKLESTFHHHHQVQSGQATPAVVVNLSPTASATPSSSTDATATTTGKTDSSTGPEIVLNLGNLTAGEQITIGLNNDSKGGEQVTIGVSGQANQSPEQITLNLNQSTNQEIVLNLFTAPPAPQPRPAQRRAALSTQRLKYGSCLRG